MTTIYVTKYALSSGIIKVDAVVVGDSASYKLTDCSLTQRVYGLDFQLTLKGALARAEELRIRKLQSLDKQHKKVSALKFKIHELN